MTFKQAALLLLGLLWMSLGGYAAEQKNDSSFELVGATRPFLIRSDFAAGKAVLSKLKNYSSQSGYSLQGYPQFQRIYSTYDLNFLETRLARSPAYAKYLNKYYLREYVLQHPEKFSAETVADYAKGGTFKNPKTIGDIPLEWHHDGKHRFLLVEKGEHHSLPHVGGNKVWGPKYADSISIEPNIEIVWTARRWMKFSAMELVWSNIALMSSHEKDHRTYAVNALASASSGFLAWSVESLTIKSFPLTIGATPYFIKLPMNMGILPMNVGGPASWIATGLFIVTKSAIMAGWKKYQLMEALEIEKSCRYAEHFTLVSSLKKAGNNNSKLLLQIIENN